MNSYLSDFVSLPRTKPAVSPIGVKWPAHCLNGHDVTLKAPNQRCPVCGSKCDSKKPYFNPRNPDNPFRREE